MSSRRTRCAWRGTATGALYAALETVTAGRGLPRTVDETAIRFPARWARYYPRVYDPDKQTFLTEHCEPGSTVLDAGAHLGLYTVLMSRSVGRTGRVLAFEPAPASFEVLERTVALNGCRNVELHRSAISGARGSDDLHIAEVPWSNANSLTAFPEAAGTAPVRTETIDEALGSGSGSVSCLKLDIEGSELIALSSARDTLERARPAISLEVHPGMVPGGQAALAELWHLLRDHRYETRRHGRPVDRGWFTGQSESFSLEVVPRV